MNRDEKITFIANQLWSWHNYDKSFNDCKKYAEQMLDMMEKEK